MEKYWDGNVLHYDYSLGDIEKIRGRDAVKVGEAWIWDEGRERSCGLIFKLTVPDETVNKISREMAIERAKEERKRLVQEVQTAPQWGQVAYINWDGTGIEWLSQQATN